MWNIVRVFNPFNLYVMKKQMEWFLEYLKDSMSLPFDIHSATVQRTRNILSFTTYHLSVTQIADLCANIRTIIKQHPKEFNIVFLNDSNWNEYLPSHLLDNRNIYLYFDTFNS